MKTSDELLIAAQGNAQAAANELQKCGRTLTLQTATKVDTMLRVAVAAVNELKNRASGHKPPPSGEVYYCNGCSVSIVAKQGEFCAMCKGGGKNPPQG